MVESPEYIAEPYFKVEFGDKTPPDWKNHIRGVKSS
jgi:hypothetical protein